MQLKLLDSNRTLHSKTPSHTHTPPPLFLLHVQRQPSFIPLHTSVLSPSRLELSYSWFVVSSALWVNQALSQALTTVCVFAGFLLSGAASRSLSCCRLWGVPCSAAESPACCHAGNSCHDWKRLENGFCMDQPSYYMLLSESLVVQRQAWMFCSDFV